MKGHQANAVKKIIELRQLPKEVQIKSKLKIESEMRNQKRILWLAAGFLDNGYDLDALNKVQKQFARIDRVPYGYVYPELYLRRDETENER